MKKNNLNAIILAAGKGARMKSDQLKVVHQVAGKPIINYVVDVVDQMGAVTIYLVVGHQAEAVKKVIKNPKVTYVNQAQQLGTGHAVMQVASHIKGDNNQNILVLAGDCPLLQLKTLKGMVAVHHKENAAVTVLTVNMDNPGMYGRIIREENGVVKGIKEARECRRQELEITEINTGAYIFNQKLLFEYLKNIDSGNKQGEYYLTDLLHILKSAGHRVSAYCMANEEEAVGVNTRRDLAQINKVLYQHNNQKMMDKGVTIIDTHTTFIGSEVSIGKDTIIEPFTVIDGNTKIGSRCVVGAYSYIKNGKIAKETTLTPYTIIKE